MSENYNNNDYDNYIGYNPEKGTTDAVWIIHGCPRGHQTNNTIKNNPFNSYADFHTASCKHIEFPSKPGKKFIKEEMPEFNCVAYTFVRTGIYEISSNRSGSNYGAITIFIDDMDEEKQKLFARDLEQWFTTNILNKYTRDYQGGWLKWNDDAQNLFDGKYNKSLKSSIQSLLQPYLSVQKSNSTQKNQNTTTSDSSNSKQNSDKKSKADTFKPATNKLQKEIQELEEQERLIREQIIRKSIELQRLTKTPEQM